MRVQVGVLARVGVRAESPSIERLAARRPFVRHFSVLSKHKIRRVFKLKC